MKIVLKMFVLSLSAALVLSGCGGSDEEVAETCGRRKAGLIQEVKPHLAGHKDKRQKKLSKKKRRALRLKRAKARAESLRKALETPPEDLSAEDRRTWCGLKDALAAEKYADVRRYAELAAKSPSAELRGDAVRALAWFGAKGMATLTNFLYDNDEGVAQEAETAWEAGLMEIDDDATKLQYLEMAMTSIDKPEMLDALSQNFNQVEDEAAAVETMMRVIKKGGIGAEKAQEAYSFMTGNDWTSASDAAQWVAEKRAEAAAAASEDGEPVEIE